MSLVKKTDLYIYKKDYSYGFDICNIEPGASAVDTTYIYLSGAFNSKHFLKFVITTNNKYRDIILSSTKDVLQKFCDVKELPNSVIKFFTENEASIIPMNAGLEPITMISKGLIL